MHFHASSLLSTLLASCKMDISTQLTAKKNTLQQHLQVEWYWSAFWLLTNSENCIKQGSEMSWIFFSVCQAKLCGPICSELPVSFCWSEPAQHHLVWFPSAPCLLGCPSGRGQRMDDLNTSTGSWDIRRNTCCLVPRRAAAWSLFVQWYRSIHAIRELISFKKT